MEKVDYRVEASHLKTEFSVKTLVYFSGDLITVENCDKGDEVTIRPRLAISDLSDSLIDEVKFA